MKTNCEDYMLISEFSRALGTTPRTVRLYEQMGLISPPRMSDKGIRHYCKEDIKRFEFVLKLKVLGISLEEMQKLAEISSSFDVESRKSVPLFSELLEPLEMHLKNIRLKIASLKSLQTDIERFKKNIILNCSSFGSGVD